MSISWEELVKLDLGCPQRSFPRTEYSESRYAAHKKILARMGMSPENYIESTVLKGREYELSTNAFPYAVPRDVMHLVFWMSRDADKLPVKLVKEIVATKIRVGYDDVVVFENPTNLRSVHGLSHYQVFVKV